MVNEINKELRDYVETYYDPLRSERVMKPIYKEENVRDRNPLQRDYSRILYSSSFRKLKGKMQLLGIQNDKFYTILEMENTFLLIKYVNS